MRSIYLIRMMLAFGLALLTACSHELPPQVVIRPALVVHPQAADRELNAYTGEVRAQYESELAFRIGGKITRRLVGVGDLVKRNQPLAELDPEDVRLQLAAAKAQLEAAKANLGLAEGDRRRYKTLLGQQVISQSLYDNAENQYRASEARLQQARAGYEVAINQTKYAVLSAPQTGVISRRLVEVGQVVAPGQIVFSFAQNSEREVRISVPEHKIKLFSIGQPVNVEIWSRDGGLLPGRVREIAPVADSQSRTFAARIAFDGNVSDVKLGQSARVFMLADGAAPLSVPLSALSADNGDAFVWVVDPETSAVIRTKVQIGAYGEQEASIKKGINPEDWVVEAGTQTLQPGQKIRPVNRDNRLVQL